MKTKIILVGIILCAGKNYFCVIGNRTVCVFCRRAVHFVPNGLCCKWYVPSSPPLDWWCAEHAGMVSQFKIFTLIKTGHLPRSVILICHSNACTSIPNRTGTVHFDVLHRLRLIQHHAVRVRVQFLPHLHVSIPYDKYTTQK